ncbi:MAG TPA: aldolase/citrate lyase family protein [Acidimicrobiales bacterium]|nr:aldolase/citrate lyase family protein [Acidimicrobiales bacterium]
MSETPAARLRALLASGATVHSTFVKLAALEVIDLLRGAGIDAVVVDLEHSQLSDAQARGLVRHAAALGLPAVVRLPSVDSGLINRLLEAGAAGIQLSTVTRRGQVEELLAACRFPPAGRRSLSLSHPAAGYGSESVSEHLARTQDGPLVVVQIETAKTDDPLSTILAGTDVAFAGTTDLAVDLGVRGPDDPAVDEVVGRIAGAVAAAGPPTVLGGWASNSIAADRLTAHGARYITMSSDLALLAGAVRRELFSPAYKENKQT